MRCRRSPAVIGRAWSRMDLSAWMGAGCADVCSLMAVNGRKDVPAATAPNLRTSRRENMEAMYRSAGAEHNRGPQQAICHNGRDEISRLHGRPRPPRLAGRSFGAAFGRGTAIFQGGGRLPRLVHRRAAQSRVPLPPRAFERARDRLPGFGCRPALSRPRAGGKKHGRDAAGKIRATTLGRNNSACSTGGSTACRTGRTTTRCCIT